MKITIILSILLLLLAGCAAKPISTEQIQNTKYDCSDVDDKIALLEKEKKDNNRRILSGIRAVFPIAVVVNVMKGNYKTNVKIATGKWAKILDEEVAQMKAYKAQCPA